MISAQDLRKFGLFSALPPEEAQRLAQHLQIRSYPTRFRLFDAGESASGFYLIFSGKVKIFRVSPEGSEQVLGIFEEGQSFAEAAVFQGGGYPAAAETLEPTELIFIDRKMILDTVRSDPEFALRLLGGMSLKLRRLVRLIDSLTLKDAKGRVARYLAGLLPADMREPVEIELPISKTLLARMLGVTGETLSRTLKSLSQDGVIVSLERGSVKIGRVEALLELAGVEGNEPPPAL